MHSFKTPKVGIHDVDHPCHHDSLLLTEVKNAMNSLPSSAETCLLLAQCSSAVCSMRDCGKHLGARNRILSTFGAAHTVCLDVCRRSHCHCKSYGSGSNGGCCRWWHSGTGSKATARGFPGHTSGRVGTTPARQGTSPHHPRGFSECCLLLGLLLCFHADPQRAPLLKHWAR